MLQMERLDSLQNMPVKSNTTVTSFRSTKPFACLVFTKGKSCVAVTFIALLLIATFTRPLFLASFGEISYARLFKHVTYATVLVLGGIYVWKRLVSDIQESYHNELQRKYDVLPTTDGGIPAVKRVNFSQSDGCNFSLFFVLWKVLVAVSLSTIVFGYFRMRLHRRNTLFSMFDNVCFTFIGSGAFLLFALFVLDCLLGLIFFCRIVLLFLQRDAKVLHGCDSCDYDQLLLSDVLDVLNHPRKVIFHWRRFSSRLVPPLMKATLCVFVTISVTFYGLHCAHKTLRVNEISIPITDLPSSLNHFSIVQVCDFHIGPWLWREHINKVVDKVNELEPDIVAIVGDLVDLTTDRVLDALQPLRRLKSKKGCFFVGGNHDYYLGDIDHLNKFLDDIGIKVLANENVKICHADDAMDCFYLVGTEDFSQTPNNQKIINHAFDLNQAMEGVDPKLPVILMTHQPMAAKEAVLTDQKFDLILSGHTHGGQFFPVSLVVYLSVPYFQGLYHIKENTYLYVSNGVGFWGIPMRLMAPPEVALISLVPSSKSAAAAATKVANV